MTCSCLSYPLPSQSSALLVTTIQEAVRFFHKPSPCQQLTPQRHTDVRAWTTSTFVIGHHNCLPCQQVRLLSPHFTTYIVSVLLRAACKMADKPQFSVKVARTPAEIEACGKIRVEGESLADLSHNTRCRHPAQALTCS